MKKKKRRSINEYDQDPAKRIQKKYRKKRRLRRFRIFMIIVVLIAVSYYFYSPYSKVQTINITGNQSISTQEIRDVIGCDENSIRLFCWRFNIKNNINKLVGVKSVKVEKSILHGMSITITEYAPIAYQQNESSATIIFENGDLKEITDAELIKKLQSLPKLSQFSDQEILQSFAKSFCEVDESVRSQMSEIIFEPLESDPLRVKMISDDNKESYVRIDDMVYQLKYYNGIVSQNPGNCYFDFLGNNVYQRACD